MDNAPEDFFAIWKADPTPGNLSATLRSLDKTISYATGSMGVGDNPQMKHQARLFAVDAIKKYDPASGVKLSTWTQGQLQSLKRFKRENAGPVKVPERAALDAWHLEKSRAAYLDQYGDEPDTAQLADFAKMSVKRIADVRRSTRAVASEAQMVTGDSQQSDMVSEALDYVYGDADKLDSQILEMTTGYGGVEMIPKNEIARRLNLSPAMVTRRTERLGQKIQEMEADINTAVG